MNNLPSPTSTERKAMADKLRLLVDYSQSIVVSDALEEAADMLERIPDPVGPVAELEAKVEAWLAIPANQTLLKIAQVAAKEAADQVLIDAHVDPALLKIPMTNFSRYAAPQSAGVSDDDVYTLQCAVENMRLAERTESSDEAKWRIAYKLEQMTKRLAAPVSEAEVIERCAKVAEDYLPRPSTDLVQDGIASAIRALATPIVRDGAK